jgi:hypothetical protein
MTFFLQLIATQQIAGFSFKKKKPIAGFVTFFICFIYLTYFIQKFDELICLV